MPLLLHIDTSSVKCCVALSSEKGILAEVVDDNPNAHGEMLTVLIQECLSQAKVNIQKLEGVSVNIGPGSFTGLRIGMSVAKGICSALDIPLIGLDGLAILSESVPSDDTKFVVLSNIRESVYFLKEDVDNSEISTCIPHSELMDVLSQSAEKSVLILEKDDAKKIEFLFSEMDIERKIVERKASLQFEMAQKYFANQEFLDLAYSQPHYIVDFVPTQAKK